MQSLKSKTKIVKTQSGPIIGECHIVPYNSSAGKMFESEVYSWLGIPYAEPPIENNRFSRPKQLKPWSNLKVTTIWPKKCIQSELGMDGNSTSEDDNTKITLFGQDAGALSVGYHLFYPESWPYFRNGIMQSGLPIGSSNNIQI